MPVAGLCLDNSTRHRDRIKAAFDNTSKTFGVPGAVLGVRADNGKTFNFATGLADLDKKVRMEAHCKFRIGSVTKTFTAMAVLLLVDKGKLSLDTTVESLLPGHVPVGKNITVRMLLQMRSGLSE